ncbi:hypothetical protein IWQ62_004441 [Dispira parvispora]|uniref:Uncharacterized protein n=1 Tax=Dispira parvispora TaxID=1520584 RepID=A0A9W8E5E5_9FUNG|nr:hypothetical protein IWQ62_004441 [Dispira parvispora]
MLRTYKVQTGLFSPSTVTIHADKVQSGTLHTDGLRGRVRAFSQSTVRLTGNPFTDPSEPFATGAESQTALNTGLGALQGNDSNAHLPTKGFSRWLRRVPSPDRKVSSESQYELGAATSTPRGEVYGMADEQVFCLAWRKSSISINNGRRVFLHDLTTGQVLWEADVPSGKVSGVTSPVRLGIANRSGGGVVQVIQLRPPAKFVGAGACTRATLRIRAEFCLVSASFRIGNSKYRWTLLSNALGVGDGSFMCVDTESHQPVARFEYSPLAWPRQSGRLSIEAHLVEAQMDSVLVFALLVALEYCRVGRISI